MKHRKIVNLSLIFIALLISPRLYSQEAVIKTGQDTSSGKYSHGIQYYLVNGISFAFKFNDTYPDVWRARFDLSGTITGNSENQKSYNQGELNLDGENETDSHSFYLSISVEYDHFFRIHNQFDPYLGIGPLIKYSRSKYTRESKLTVPQNSSNSYEDVTTSYGIGLIGVAGIESKLLDFINLFIEYNLSYTYNWNNDKYISHYQPSDSGNQDERDGNSWLFNLSSARIGMILYF